MSAPAQSAPRYIEIAACGQCPHRDHRGGFGNPAYIPVCRMAGKTMPYKTVASDFGRPVASQLPGIPEWCPLPVLPQTEGRAS